MKDGVISCNFSQFEGHYGNKRFEPKTSGLKVGLSLYKIPWIFIYLFFIIIKVHHFYNIISHRFFSHYFYPSE